MRAGWEERSRRHWQGVGRKDQEAGSIIEQKEHESREWEARRSREQRTELEKQRAVSRGSREQVRRPERA